MNLSPRRGAPQHFGALIEFPCIVVEPSTWGCAQLAPLRAERLHHPRVLGLCRPSTPDSVVGTRRSTRLATRERRFDDNTSLCARKRYRCNCALSTRSHRLSRPVFDLQDVGAVSTYPSQCRRGHFQSVTFYAGRGLALTADERVTRAFDDVLLTVVKTRCDSSVRFIIPYRFGDLLNGGPWTVSGCWYLREKRVRCVCLCRYNLPVLYVFHV